MEQPFSMTVNNQEEADFFLKHLKKNHTVLEWGSGASTIEIAKHVKKLVSIEHNESWYNKVSQEIPENVDLHYVPFNTEEDPGHDGTYEQYKDYVDKAVELSKQHGKFDVIFIDGRARVACAAICKQIAHKNTLVFIHDYNHPNPQYLRQEYFEAEEHLNRLSGEFTMWKFAVKGMDEDAPETVKKDDSDKKKDQTLENSSLNSSSAEKTAKKTVKKPAEKPTVKPETPKTKTSKKK